MNKRRFKTMKKTIMILMLGFMFTIPGIAKAGGLIGGNKMLANETLVVSGATVTCNAIDLRKNEYIGIWYKIDSGAGPDVKITYEMSYNDVDANFVTPEGVSNIETNLTDTEVHIDSIQCPPMRYLRIKVYGNAGNGADTKITIVLFVQEQS
jgi:hypothetical protein